MQGILVFDYKSLGEKIFYYYTKRTFSLFKNGKFMKEVDMNKYGFMQDISWKLKVYSKHNMLFKLYEEEINKIMHEPVYCN